MHGTFRRRHQGPPAHPPAPPGAPLEHDPSALQSVLARAEDQSRYAAPEAEESRPATPLPWRAAAWLLGAVLLLAVGFGVLYALVLRAPAVDPDTIVQIPEGSPSAVMRSPQDAVRGYLQALADGDLQRALSFGELGGSGSRALLDQAAHAQMRERAPISAIEIITQDPKATEIRVAYNLGGDRVDTTIPVVKDDRGNYGLARTTVTVVIELGQAEALPLLVGGVEVPKFTPLEVVPGTYELTAGLAFIEYPKENSFTIRSLQFADETSFPATPRLTSAGADAFRGAVQRSLLRCQRATVPAPEGCPQGVAPAKPLVPSTIRWGLVGNPLSKAEPSLSAEDLSQATMALDLAFTLTFDYADGSSPGVQDVRVTARATATMLGKDASDVAVTWRR